MTNSSSKLLTIPMTPLNGLKKGAKPFSTKSANKLLNNNNFGPNLPAKWKRNKYNRIKSGKVPAPRSSGVSKSNKFIINNFGYGEDFSNLEPVQQSGVIDMPELEDIDFSNLFDYEVCDDLLQQLLMMQCVCVRRAHDLGVVLVIDAPTCDMANAIYEFYNNHEKYSFPLSSYLQRSLRFNQAQVAAQIRAISCLLTALQNWMFLNFADKISGINQQGGIVSKGLPVNINVDVKDLDRLSDITDGATKELVSQISDMLNNVDAIPVEVKHTFENPLSGFDIVAFVKKYKSVIGIVVLAFIAFNAIVNQGTYMTIFNVVASLATVYVVANPQLSIWLKDLVEYVRSKTTASNAVVAQGGFASFFSTDGLNRLAIVGVLTSICTNLRAETASTLVTEFFQKIANMKRISEGTNFTLEFLFKLVQDFLNWFTDLTNLKKVNIVNDPFWEVSLFGERVHEKKMDYVKDPLKDSSFASELSQLRADGEEIRSRICKMPGCQQQMNVLSSHLKELNDLMVELNSRLVTVNGIRPEPFMMLTLGHAGIGKTTFINNLIPEITAETLPDHKLDHYEAHPGEYIHTYNPGDQYYSGYHGQHNLIVDEFGFMKDCANGQATIWSELIQWVNVNPMNLTMADLNSKGRVYFRSQNIWGTSNLRHFNNIESVVDKQAIFRRLKFTWVAAVKVEYATDDTQTLGPWDRDADWEKVNEAGADEDFSYLEFYRMVDLRTGQMDNVAISVHELKERILKAIADSKQSHSELTDKIESTVNRILKRRRNQKAYKQDGETCGKCPGCDQNLHLLKDETIDQYLVRLFSLLFDGKEVAQVCGSNVDFEEFKILYKILLSEGDIIRMSRRYGPCQCVSFCTNLDSFIATLIIESARNRSRVLLRDEDQERTGFGSCMSFMKSAAIAFAVVAPFIWIVKRIWRAIFPSEKVVPEADYPMRSKRNKKSVTKLRRIQIQAGDDPNAHNIITKLVTRNLWRFSVDLGNNKLYQGCVLALQNNVVLMPEHYISKWMDLVNGDPEEGVAPQPHLEITFTNCNKRNPMTGELKPHSFTRTLKDLLTACGEDGELTIEIFKLGSNELDDVGIVYIPGITGRVITKLFRSKDQKLPTQHRGILGVVNRDFSPVYHTANFKTRKDVVYANGDWGCENGIQYDIPTRMGDCGSPFVVFDKSNEAKIASIHVAGIGNMSGIGAVVDRESIEAGIRMCCAYHDVLQDVAEMAAAEEVKPLVQSGYVVADDGNTYEAIAKKIPQANKTKIVPSPINGLVEGATPKKKPAMLRKTGPIDPMANAMWGYGLSNVRPRLDFLRCATMDYCNELFNTNYVITPEMRRPLTNNESVEGIPGEDFIDAVNRETSPGFPMKHLLKKGSKKSAFGNEEFIFDSEDAQLVFKMMRDMEDQILKGFRPYVLNHHFLKDELRPIAKADTGATRLISSCDFIFGLLVRKYTLMFSAFVMRTRINNGVACGTNPFSGDWNLLAIRHGANRPNYRVIAGDFSRYDKSLAPNDIWILKDVMMNFYKDYHSPSARIRNALIDEIAQSRHLVDNLVYSWMGGNTSGNPLTTVINSISGCVLDRYAILINYPEPIRDYAKAESILTNMRDYVKITRYGDDSLISVQTIGPYDFITQQFMTEAFERIGMVYTDESKGTMETSDDRTLSQCTFLKRGFTQSHYANKKRWMAPLSLESILESIQWSKDHDLGWVFWKGNVDHMLVELSAHPRPIFDLWSKRIEMACLVSDVAHVVVVPGYRDLQDKFVTTDHNY